MRAIAHEILPILLKCIKEGGGSFFVTARHEVVCVLTLSVIKLRAEVVTCHKLIQEAEKKGRRLDRLTMYR